VSEAVTDDIPAVHRAAILLVMLGPEVAGTLLNRLPEKSAREIIAEVARLGTIEPSAAERVLDDYVMDVVRPEQYRGGAELAQQMLGGLGIPQEQHAELLGAEPEDPARQLLSPLADSPAGVLSAALADEHRQTAALVLLNLGARKAAEVLSGMPDEVRSEVVLRMTQLRHVRGELLQEVVDSLGRRLQDTTATAVEDQADGLQRTATVLQTMARGAVRELLEGLERESPDDAAKLREMVFTFDSLVLADDRGVQELLRSVETKTVALALQGVEPELSDKFLSNLSERAAGMLKEEIEFLGTVRPADQHAAQAELIQRALELEQEEKLVFAEIMED